MILTLFNGSNSDVQVLESLGKYLQSEMEERSRILARQLHDNVGSNLIAAIMDVAWLSRHPSFANSDIATRLHRIDDSLTNAVEATRRLVDELQPALIDSIGLLVAVSAHFTRECGRFNLPYRETVVGVAPGLDSGAAMTVFRIAQAFLQWIRDDTAATEIYAHFDGEDERLTMRFVARGIAAAELGNQGQIAPRLASIALRLRKLNGTLTSDPDDGSVTIAVQIPAVVSPPQIPA
jgi:signal transduction histidine kinase